MPSSPQPAGKTREEAHADAQEFARKMVAKLREENAEYERRTGKPSSVSNADYARCEEELVAAAMKLWQATRLRDTHRRAEK